ncbi:MAG: head GIN domain-containing protein [Marinirhabdus sp.]|nr:head GIN domain-containing protein [Marinirhabdus sp.]
MKTINTLALFVVLWALNPTNLHAQWKKVKGSGNVTETTFITQAYDNVKVVGSLSVNLISGTEGNLTIKADDNLHEYVEIENNGGVLKIKLRKGISYTSKNDILVTVPFTDLSEVSLTGSGDVTSNSTLRGSNLTLNVTGSGDMNLNIEGDTVDAKVTGSGDMVLSGTANNLEVKVTGSGDFEGFTLSAKNTEAYISGSGDAEVTANEGLKARVHGSGDIRYKGNPGMSDTKVMGSGTIKSN